MARRKLMFADGQIYHVFNRSLDRRAVFDKSKICLRTVKSWWFFQYENSGMSFTDFWKMSAEARLKAKKAMARLERRVEILAYCLMPNHYHILLKQLREGGVAKMVGDFQNSITRYFNMLAGRRGPLFESRFQAVRVESDEQLIHVSRYIHLNPMTGFVVGSLDDLLEYRWSSLPEYLGKVEMGMCEVGEVMGFFSGSADYWEFVRDQANYQRELARMRHLLLDD